MEKGLEVKFYPNKKSEKSRFYKRITVLVVVCIIINLVVLGFHLKDSFKNTKNDKPIIAVNDTIKPVNDETTHFYSGHSYLGDSLDNPQTRNSHFKHLIELLDSEKKDSSNFSLINHNIEKGETLNSIAEKYNVTVSSIKKLNNLSNNNIIIGGFLKIQKFKTSLGYYGIDVSSWQNNINWVSVKSDSIPHDLSFFIIKATQGTNITDAFFAKNWNKIKSISSAPIGAYHFFMSAEDPIKQAENYIKSVKLQKGDLLPIIDVELDCGGCSALKTPKNELVNNLKTYIQLIEKHYGVKPIIYTYSYFYEQYLKGNFDNYTYWMARYSDQPPPGMNLFGSQSSSINPEICMWQFSCSEKINGIAGNVDMSFVPYRYLQQVIIK